MTESRFGSDRIDVATEVDLTMMERAIELAGRAAALDEVPVGAVVYRDGTIIAEAFNNRHAARHPTAHAE